MKEQYGWYYGCKQKPDIEGNSKIFDSIESQYQENAHFVCV